jgi:hypothetical protein
MKNTTKEMESLRMVLRTQDERLQELLDVLEKSDVSIEAAAVRTREIAAVLRRVRPSALREDIR